MIIVLVETWLCEGIANSEFDLHNYNIHRFDGNSTTSDFRMGHMLIAVRKSLFICFL